MAIAQKCAGLLKPWAHVSYSKTDNLQPIYGRVTAIYSNFQSHVMSYSWK